MSSQEEKAAQAKAQLELQQKQHDVATGATKPEYQAVTMGDDPSNPLTKTNILGGPSAHKETPATTHDDVIKMVGNPRVPPQSQQSAPTYHITEDYKNLILSRAVSAGVIMTEVMLSSVLAISQEYSRDLVDTELHCYFTGVNIATHGSLISKQGEMVKQLQAALDRLATLSTTGRETTTQLVDKCNSLGTLVTKEISSMGRTFTKECMDLKSTLSNSLASLSSSLLTAKKSDSASSSRDLPPPVNPPVPALGHASEVQIFSTSKNSGLSDGMSSALAKKYAGRLPLEELSKLQRANDSTSIKALLTAWKSSYP